ncbi:F-box/FBD/LRR-repeat protein At1g13570-like [Carex rostrata]
MDDYISKLPDNIQEKILAELSLKEAVRTSILSRTWKDSWTSLPNLVFPDFPFEEESTEPRLIELVDKVLRVHRGPIQKFKLVSQHACIEAIGRWMLILSTNEIEHLDLNFSRMNGKIPSCFFSCNTLKSVCLSGCSINVPLFFNGFTLLHTLCLSYFNLSEFDIEKLVSSCPLLEHLELANFFQQGCLRILAPKLTFLAINGDFQDISLEAPKLVEGSICLFEETGDYQEFSAGKDGAESNITRALGHLSNIQKLDIRGEFINYLSMGPNPENLPSMFPHLTEIYVQLMISLDEIVTALCLFENAPNLKLLHIEVCNSLFPLRVQGLQESKAILDCLFKHLEDVNVFYHRDPELLSRKAKSILEFGQLVSSTALEEFRVTALGYDIGVFEELKLLPKLSEKCKLVLLRDEESDDEEESDGDA